MTEEDKIKQVLYQFEDGGLVSKDVEMVIDCLTDPLLGIGLGEQGFVTSQSEVRQLLMETQKDDPPFSHTIRYNRIEVLLHSDCFASICAEVIVTPKKNEGVHIIESHFRQMLSLKKENDVWKICALHSSTPVITEDCVEAYPLRFADSTLQSLQERIGAQVYLAEEQYRQAILSDTIAFYIINFTKDICEKSQCNNTICANIPPDTSYDRYASEHAASFIHDLQERNRFLSILSLENIRNAFRNGSKELSCEYRLKNSENQYFWCITIVRLITDVQTGDQKGIMYVRDIDQSKREELALLAQAAYDGMTGLYNKVSFIRAVDSVLTDTNHIDGGTLIMFDVDNFKMINDTYGHPTGDLVLVSIAHLLEDFFPSEALAARLGGDEFGIFLPESPMREQLISQLHQFNEKLKLICLSHLPDVRFTCSIGVAKGRQGDTFHTVLYPQADAALYQAKKSGKNQVAFAAKV